MTRLLPRGTLDVGWTDLAAALAACATLRRIDTLQTRIARAWGTGEPVMACLSVRSGLDLYLQSVRWPRGSEVLVSALTIPDMVRVLAHHGLVPVPVDIDPHTLDIAAGELTRAATPRTRAVLVAHLFGAQLDLHECLRVAHARGWRVIEDCAQAYDGTFRGHPDADVRMFSFGPIKTATALGGAVLMVRDAEVVSRMRTLQAASPRQQRRRYMRRVIMAAIVKALLRPTPFALLDAWCRARGAALDSVLRRTLRGFPPHELMVSLRHAPSAPLLAMLVRRLRQDHRRRVAARMARAERLIAATSGAQWPGRAASRHTHWVMPMVSRDPDALVRALKAAGVDATRHGSSLAAVPSPPGHPHTPPRQAARFVESVVYLPAHPKMSVRRLQRVAAVITAVELKRVDDVCAAAPSRSRTP